MTPRRVALTVAPLRETWGMANCANPACPRPHLRMSRHVQILEQEGTNRTHFAAVTCSKRCAIAVLAPLAEQEDQQREDFRQLLASGDN